jgi:hypothetical protein
MEPIERAMAELDGVLRGPRRAKADLLAEARDGLHDAAQSYMDAGEPAGAACRRAVAEFGPVAEIAAGFQAELSIAQARRTALWVALAVAVQPVVWGPLRPGADDHDLTAAQALIDRLIETLGVVALCGAVLVLLASGTGVRLLGTRPVVARLTGLFALTVTAGFVVMAGAMLAVGDPGQLWALAGVPWALAFLVSPMTAVAWSARRCLALPAAG